MGFNSGFKGLNCKTTVKFPLLKFRMETTPETSHISQTMVCAQRNVENDVIAYHYPISLQEYVVHLYYSDAYSVCGRSTVG